MALATKTPASEKYAGIVEDKARRLGELDEEVVSLRETEQRRADEVTRSKIAVEVAEASPRELADAEKALEAIRSKIAALVAERAQAERIIAESCALQNEATRQERAARINRIQADFDANRVEVARAWNRLLEVLVREWDLLGKAHSEGFQPGKPILTADEARRVYARATGAPDPFAPPWKLSLPEKRS